MLPKGLTLSSGQQAAERRGPTPTAYDWPTMCAWLGIFEEPTDERAVRGAAATLCTPETRRRRRAVLDRPLPTPRPPPLGHPRPVASAMTEREKSGFGRPLGAWWHNYGYVLRSRVRALADAGLVPPGPDRRLVDDTVSGRRDAAWALACSQAWHDEHATTAHAPAGAVVR